MENLDIFDPLEEEVEVVLGGSVKVRRTSTEMKKISGGVSNWLERALNDSECVMAPGISDCQINATLTLGNFTAPIVNSTSTVLPPSLGFDDNAMTDIIIYSVMFVVAAVGNLTVFITLFRNRHRKSRVNLMIMHLAAADLMVTLINFPLEVGWRITTQWVAGNLACKLFQFLRAFGLYLSSLVLVCISLDRYFAIVHPLKVNDAQRRGKIMLTFAWSIAAVCSLPQSVIFHVDTHPVFQNFKQCVTFGFFRTQVEEMTYNLFCLAAMYFMPLLVIIVVYFRILWEISQKSKDSKEEPSGRGGRGGRMRLRRSDMSNIERARARTLRMTVIIVLAFIWCWTPYVVIVMWYMFDRESAEQVHKRLQDALFIMAVSNSCVNPLVYGTYTINFRNELNRCFGRKTKPQVLARKSTGSTAMRTTVTAQLTTGSTLKMSTHTQVVQREGSGKGSSRRAPSTESHYSTPHPRHPLLPSPLSQAPISTPTLSTSPTTSVQPVAQTVTASGCLMVEIEVDMDSQPSGDVVSTQLNDLTTTCTVQTATSTTCGVQTTAPTCVLQTTTPGVVEAASSKESQKENNSGASSSVSETRNKVTDSVKLTPTLPSHGEAQITDNKTGRMKLTAFLRTDGKSPPTPGKYTDGQDVTKDTFILGRKFSADSGVFFDSRYKRLHHNSLIDIITDPADVRRHSDNTTNIELKSITPLHDIK